MNVIVLKMISGDEVIAKKTASMSEPGKTFIDRPRVMQLMRAPDGSAAAGLVPYLISDPDRREIPINDFAIVTQFPASKELSDSYLQSVTSLQLLS